MTSISDPAPKLKSLAMNGSGGEIDLNARWEETCASFANTAQGKSLKRSPIPTPEQVVEAIRRKGKDSKKPDKWEKLGTVVGNVGFALLQFGEVASQAASMVCDSSSSGGCFKFRLAQLLVVLRS